MKTLIEALSEHFIDHTFKWLFKFILCNLCVWLWKNVFLHLMCNTEGLWSNLVLEGSRRYISLHKNSSTEGSGWQTLTELFAVVAPLKHRLWDIGALFYWAVTRSITCNSLDYHALVNMYIIHKECPNYSNPLHLCTKKSLTNKFPYFFTS